jgi:hypothetical protein
MPITQLDPHTHLEHLAVVVISNNTKLDTHYWNSAVAVQNHFHVDRSARI